MLRCREVTQRASAYIDHELSFWATVQYRMHLAMCRHCRRFIHNFRRGILMVQHLHRVSVDQAQVDAVALRIRRLDDSPPEQP